MKWWFAAGAVVLVLAAVAGVIALIGSRLPQAHVASREGRVSAPPEAVWQAITNVDAFNTWRAGVSRVQRLPDREGKTTWIEHTSDGRLTLTVEHAEPPRLLVIRLADPDLPFGGTWTYEIAAASAGSTVVRITEHGEIYNPAFRFMARYVFGHHGTIEKYLASLEKKLSSEV
jgi:uncharacterized protein YndB with AHSA1/START domain